MKKKYIKKVILMFFAMIFVSGCWGQHELDALAIVMGTGFDKQDGEDNVTISLQILNPVGIKSASGSSTSNDSKSYFNINKTGKTVLSTINDISYSVNQKLYFPHNQVLAIGYSAAESGFHELLDYFVRDPAIRSTVWITIVDGVASDLWDIESENIKLPTNYLRDLFEVQKTNSKNYSSDIQHFISRMLSNTTSPIAPIIKIENKNGNKIVSISGTAVFKEDRLIGRLDTIETRGLLWIINKVGTGIIDIKCPNSNDYVSIEIVSASSKLNAVILDENIVFNVKIDLIVNIGGQKCQVDLTQEKNIKLLKQLIEQQIKDEIYQSFNKAKVLKSDIFGFGEKFHQKYPHQWRDIASSWVDIFEDIDLEIDVNVKIKQSGKLSKPVEHTNKEVSK